MTNTWKVIKGNDGFPAETQNVYIVCDGYIFAARFLAPCCEFVTRDFPTRTFKNVTHWKPREGRYE